MKTASSDLFDLIRSLSPAEKTYFKKFAAALTFGETADYISLFNAIEKQSNYDEPALKQKFKKHAIGKNFAYNKIYLYQIIIRTLKNFHAERNVQFEVISMLEEIQILQQRGLFHLARKTNAKLEKTALEHGIYFGVIESLRWKNALMETKNKVARNEEMYAYSKQILSVMKEYEEAMFYYHLYRALFRITVKPFFQEDKILQQELELIGKALETRPANEKNILSHLMYFFCSHVYHSVLGDKKKTIIYIEKLIKYFILHKKYIETNFEQFIASIANYINSLVMMQNNVHADLMLQYLFSVKTYGKHQQVFKFINYYQNESLFCIKFGYFSRYLRQAADAEFFTEDLPDYVSVLNKIFYNHYALCIQMLSQNYNSAILHLNRIFDYIKEANNVELLLNNYTMAVILYFDKRDKRLLKHYTDACCRLYIKHKQTNTIGYFFVNYLRLHFVNKTDPDFSFSVFHDVIQKKFPTHNGYCVLQSFNYVFWIESQTSGKNYESIAAKKCRNKNKALTLKQFIEMR
ncbi:MAG: hypothetical protein H7Y00_03440 [Fimbriimonadaceae bacterium]|nr:hypothetical protein [Chitinophagales bacterium]